ncbi:MAG: DUF2520 domain-containing protein [Acidobacteria bacterium]|nr:DUF2520 domain-containing protein [Acidobacteriota bacterium]
MQRVTVVGLGRVGGALTLALDRKGYQITNVVVRDKRAGIETLEKFQLRSKPAIYSWPIREITDTDILLITVRDPEIQDVAEKLAAHVSNVKVSLHTSGSRSSKEIEALLATGSAIGSMHPLVSVSDPIAGSNSFQGAYFCVEGDEPAISTASDIVSALEAHSFTLDTGLKPLYHASAVMSAGHIVALFDMAIEALSRCGVENAQEILRPLLASTTSNLQEQSTGQALTGSFARRDHETVKAHIKALKANLPAEVLAAYLLLGERSLKITSKSAANASASDHELRNVINIAKENLE